MKLAIRRVLRLLPTEDDVAVPLLIRMLPFAVQISTDIFLLRVAFPGVVEVVLLLQRGSKSCILVNI